MCVLYKIAQTTDSRISEEFQPRIMTAEVVKDWDHNNCKVFSLVNIINYQTFFNISLI